MTSAMRSSPGGPLWWTLGTDCSRRRGRLTFPGTTVRKVSAALPKSEPPIIRLPRTTAASSNQRSDCPLPQPRSRIRKRARTTRFARAHRRCSRKSPGRGYTGDPHCSLRCAWSRPSILLHSPNTRVAHRMRLEFPVRRVGGSAQRRPRRRRCPSLARTLARLIGRHDDHEPGHKMAYPRRRPRLLPTQRHSENRASTQRWLPLRRLPPGSILGRCHRSAASTSTRSYRARTDGEHPGHRNIARSALRAYP